MFIRTIGGVNIKDDVIILLHFSHMQMNCDFFKQNIPINNQRSAITDTDYMVRYYGSPALNTEYTWKQKIDNCNTERTTFHDLNYYYYLFYKIC